MPAASSFIHLTIRWSSVEKISKQATHNPRESCKSSVCLLKEDSFLNKIPSVRIWRYHTFQDLIIRNHEPELECHVCAYSSHSFMPSTTKKRNASDNYGPTTSSTSFQVSFTSFPFWRKPIFSFQSRKIWRKNSCICICLNPAHRHWQKNTFIF